MKKSALAALIAGLLLSTTPAGAAEQAAWVGSVTLPALLERLPAAPRPTPARAARLLDPAGTLAPRCLAGPLPPASVELLQRHEQAQRRLRVAALFFAAQAAEDEENLATEVVAASYGRATKPAPDLSAATRGGFELAYREAYARREAARLRHRLARLQLAQALGGERALGEALEMQSLAWPMDDANANADEGQAAPPPLQQALNLLRARAGLAADCRAGLARLAEVQGRQTALDRVKQRGRLQLALDGERKAAQLRQSLAENALDQAREALAATEAGTPQALALYAAEIESARAAAALSRVQAAALLADLRLQALQGRLPTPPTSR